MKKHIFIIPLLLVLNTCLFAQSRDNALLYDFKLNDTIRLGASESEIVNALGPYFKNGSEVKKEYWEIDKVWAIVFPYTNKGELFMLEDRLETFEITGSGFTLNYQTHSFKVGNNISSLKDAFPISYAGRKDNSIVVTLYVLLDHGERYYLPGGGMVFNFDPTTNLITKIYTAIQ